MKKYLFLLIIICNIKIYASPRATIVMDVDSGRILYQENAYEKKLIASTTKIMTFIVAYEYAKDFFDVYVEAGDEILKMYGTSIYISYKEKMLLRDLLYGLMLRSGNDAASIIAKFVGGSDEGFVKLMNKKAKSLGMNNTIFSNPHGLDEVTENISTAYDMALLSRYANHIPFYQKVTSTKYYKTSTEIKAYSWTNRNKFLFMYPNYVSGKTGYTPKAGKTLVTSARNNNLHLTIVSLNDSNHYENQRLLYDEMFKKYHNILVVSKDSFNLEHPDLLLKKDIYYPLTKEEAKKIEINLVLNDLDSNIAGELVIKLYNKEIIREYIFKNITSSNNKTETNFLDNVKKILKKIF